MTGEGAGLTGEGAGERWVAAPHEVEVFAPAKVNLRLVVHARRADGFHDLTTWMAMVDFGDRLFLSAAPERDGVSLEVGGPLASADIPTDERNLVVRALNAALDRARELGHEAPGVKVRLEKNVPSQAGLGGASSDARAALHAFETSFTLDLGERWRESRLESWGSDCVFFEKARRSGIARCEGRGEQVTEIDVAPPEWWFVVVTPDVACATPAVFSALEFPLSDPTQLPNVPRDTFTGDARSARLWMFNHLESAAMRSFPAMVEWRRILHAAGAEHFVLSGSGSSFLGLFDDLNEAEATLARIRTEARHKHRTVRGSWVARPGGQG